MAEVAARGEDGGDIEAVSAAEVRDSAEVVVQNVILLMRHERDDLIVRRIRPQQDRRPLGEAEPFVLPPSHGRGAEVLCVVDDLVGEAADAVRVCGGCERRSDNDDVKKPLHVWLVAAGAALLILWALWPSPYSKVVN